MFKIALKGVLARKTRLLLTSLAVMLGTAFLTGTTVFTDTIRKTFDSLFADVFQDVDAYTRSTSVIEQDFGAEERGTISAKWLPAVQAVDGVREAQMFVQGYAAIIDKDGDVVGTTNGPPTFGGTVNTGALGFWTFEEGRPPINGDEVALDEASFDKTGYALGDRVQISGVNGTQEFTIVGVARFGDVKSPGGSTFALFDDATAATFVNGAPDKYNAIIIQGDGSLSQEELAARVNAAINDSTVETITGKQITEEVQSDIRKGLSFFSVFLTVFAAIALFVATFVIYNLFSITVAQRRRENALLRAVGASRRQVTTATLVEALMIGIVGSLVGLGAGVGLSLLLKAALGAAGIDIPSSGLSLRSSTIVTTIVVGVLVTLTSALLPALRGSKVPPVAAMRAEAVEQVGWSRRRLVIGAVVMSLGVAGILVALGGGEISLLGLGAVLLFVGLFVLGPLFARPVAGLMRRPLKAARGITGQMAADNASRNPKRTARTAAALLVGAALVTGVTVLASSVKSSIRDIFGRQFTGDLTVNVDSFGFGGLPVSLAGKLDALPEIDTATGIGIASAELKGKNKGTFITTVDPTTVTKLFDLNVLAGSIADLGETNIAVSKKKADKDDLTIGSTVDFDVLGTGPASLTVVAIYDEDALAGPYTVSKAAFAKSDDNLYDFSVFLTVADGVSGDDAKAAVAAVTKEVAPAGKVKLRDEYIDDQVAQVDPLLNLMIALLMLSVVIAAIGIVITLLLSVYERRRELGLLRAVGMTKRQVRSAVRWEALVVTLLGAVEGVIVGLFLGFAVVRSLRDDGLKVFSIPLGWILAIFVLAVLIGVIAAIIPARRATKVDILEAIATT